METSTHQKSFHAEKDSLYFQMEALFSWVVFCAQNQGYLQVGDIVWFGNTAALAWQLPTDPKLFYFFKDHEKLYESHRRNDASKTIYYLDEAGKVLTKMPYKKRLIVNPAFAKRSIEEAYNGKNFSIVIKALHDSQKENDVLKKLDEDSITFHREGRKSLYEKLEKFLEGLGWRGRECVLRMLCETGRGKNEQGTFLEEIMRATLTHNLNGRACILRSICEAKTYLAEPGRSLVHDILKAIFTAPLHEADFVEEVGDTYNELLDPDFCETDYDCPFSLLHFVLALNKQKY
ncbi:hypothetical protein RR46_05723 [Papilio xuthus]|uniref:Uncharacterized protein n=1 Tax=Papilio xuthus TaxID=66420 RepID=A0A194PUM3_PAPXU|nr:hypothetical protein RR46_05723 [Papilio xuthus]